MSPPPDGSPEAGADAPTALTIRISLTAGVNDPVTSDAASLLLSYTG